MKGTPPAIIRNSIIVGMKNYSKERGKWKDLSMSQKDATRMKDYLMKELDWPLPIILTDNSS
jgi:hypothetical protein